MKKSNIIKSIGNDKRFTLRISFILFAAFFLPFTTTTVRAASAYITVEEFAKELAKEIGLKPADGSEESRYVKVLIEKSIIKPDDFSSYTTDLTRTDAGVLLNRADEYLYGDTLDPKLVELALEKRISDIRSIKEDKRLDVIKCYLKGFIKGYSNGKYSTDRKFKGNCKMSHDGALKCIAMLKDKSLRAKISPDGQLIRTTKLPVYANKYPYILESYPNEYYDWEFRFERATRESYNKKLKKFINEPFIHLDEYAYPAEIDQTTYIKNFPKIKDQFLDIWVDKAKNHLETIFNADYRTIDDNWVETLIKTDFQYGHSIIEDNKRLRINNYVDRMKKNKTIIESKKIALDRSTLYYFDGRYFFRAYVRYRIVSSNIPYDGPAYETNDIIYTSHPISFNNYKLGEWKECFYDVALSSYADRDKGDLGVLYAIIVDPFYTERIVK